MVYVKVEANNQSEWSAVQLLKLSERVNELQKKFREVEVIFYDRDYNDRTGQNVRYAHIEYFTLCAHDHPVVGLPLEPHIHAVIRCR